MNPFANAKIYGYGAEEILKFLQVASPKTADKIQKSIALGYTAEEIVKFLGKSFDGSGDNGQGPDYDSALRIMGDSRPQARQQAKAERKNKDNDVLSTVFQHGIPAAIGAGLGAMAGGPIGALAGGAAGAAGASDLMNRYREHTNHGGKLSVKDWLKSIIKAGGTYASVSQAPKLLAALEAGNLFGGGSGGSGEPDQLSEGEEVIAAPTEEVTAEIQGFGPEESFKALEDAGLGQIMSGLGPKLGQKDFTDYVQSQMGKKRFKELGRKYGRPPEEIVGAAWEFIQSGGQAPGEDPQQPQQAPLPSSGIPTEDTVEADVLEEMAGGVPGAVGGGVPGAVGGGGVQAQPPQVPQSVGGTDAEPRKEGDLIDNKKARDVKKLSMKDSDESYLADAFANIFDTIEDPYESPPSDKKRKIEPLSNALKSSNVRGGQWNEETGEMRITFQPKKGSSEGGSVYTYPGVDKKTWEGLTGGDAQPITEGSNIFGFWDRGKKRSIGAFFSKEIKKKADQFPPTQLAEENINVDENQVRLADRTFMVSDLFEPFKKQRAHGKRLTKAEDLKEWVSDYADHSPEDMYTMIQIIEGKLESVLKTPLSTVRLKKEITEEFGVTFNETDEEKAQIAKKAARKKEQEAKKAARKAAKKGKK